MRNFAVRSRPGFRPGSGRPAPWHATPGGAPRPDAADYIESDGLRLRVAAWRGGGRGTVLLLPGRTEYLEKYAPFAAELTGRGFSVASLDWRGQGLSDRDPDALRLGHVDAFGDYQQDLAALDRWQAEKLGEAGPRLLIAHSMGGCIGLRALLDGALSDDGARPDAAVFSAPMWGLALPRAAQGPARLLARLASRFGFAHRRARGSASEKTYVLDEPFDGNALVSDPAVWTRFRKEAAARPELTLGSPTFGWIDAAFREMRALERAGPLPVPSLLLLGEEEAVVSPAAIRARAAAPDAALAAFPQARHEPLMETPATPLGRSVRDALDAFIDARGL